MLCTLHVQLKQRESRQGYSSVYRPRDPGFSLSAQYITYLVAAAYNIITTGGSLIRRIFFCFFSLGTTSDEDRVPPSNTSKNIYIMSNALALVSGRHLWPPLVVVQPVADASPVPDVRRVCVRGPPAKARQDVQPRDRPQPNADRLARARRRRRDAGRLHRQVGVGEEAREVAQRRDQPGEPPRAPEGEDVSR